jgi:hypothetical protein
MNKGPAAERGGPRREVWCRVLSSVASPHLFGGDARGGPGTVPMREGEEMQEATRMRTANSRASEEGSAMRRTDSTRSCALAASRRRLASPRRRTSAGRESSPVRADRGLLERHRPSLRGRSKKPGSVHPSRAGPTGRRGCVPEPRRHPAADRVTANGPVEASKRERNDVITRLWTRELGAPERRVLVEHVLPQTPHGREATL